MSNELIINTNNKLTIRNTKIIKYDSKNGCVIKIQPILLLDISGSMESKVDNIRKIDRLREAVSTFYGIRKYAFSDFFNEIEHIPEPRGCTNLALAFRTLRKFLNNDKNVNLTLVSDGLPNNENEALNEALELKIPVHVMYIGEKNSDGENFMKKLAELTGGKELTADVLTKESFQKHLTEGIKGLLYG